MSTNSVSISSHGPQAITAMKDVSMLGAALLIASFGSGPLSLERNVQ